MSTILLPPSTTPTLQRLNSRGMLRSLPGDDDAQAVGHKAQQHDDATRHWLAPPLEPKVLAPLRHSKAADAAIMLQRIECIEIASVAKHDDNKRYYVMNIFLKREQSRIPTNQLHTRPLLHKSHHDHADTCDLHESKQPDFTVERRFSEFERLKKDVWETVQYPHRHYCSFCDGFMFMLLFSSAQPGMLAKTVLRSSDLRAKILDKFLHNLVGEFQRNRPRCRFACHALGHLPVILSDFLFGREDRCDDDEISERSSAASIASNASDSTNPAESP